VSRAFATTKASSLETGREAAVAIARGFQGAPRIVLAHLTVNHDQPAFLRGLRDVLGAGVPIVGCSAQGVIGSGLATEDGYGGTVLGLGGDSVAVAEGGADDIAVDTVAKGKALGRALRAQLAQPPKVAVVFYDPLAGADADLFLQGLHDELECPIVGGGASHSYDFSALQETYQYRGDRVLTRGAVAFALAGDFTAELDICHGCSPVGVDMMVTRASANILLELDGRPALEVWRGICGDSSNDDGIMTTLGIGVHTRNAAGADEYLVRSGYGSDPARGGVVLGAAIPEGTRVMLHHRTTEEVLRGAERMGRALRDRLAGKTVRAVLCFECGARTRPFLGVQDTLKENLGLQQIIGADAAWFGGMFWGELFPVAGRPAFHNYSYPILALAD
jgi:small ligand-binding sensory domain FIST